MLWMHLGSSSDELTSSHVIMDAFGAKSLEEMKGETYFVPCLWMHLGLMGYFECRGWLTSSHVEVWIHLGQALRITYEPTLSVLHPIYMDSFGPIHPNCFGWNGLTSSHVYGYIWAWCKTYFAPIPLS